jgi:N-acyl-D-amino-acid deacylase
VVVNGALALDHGQPTGKPTGRVVHGRAWKGYGSGCRASPADWRWPA